MALQSFATTGMRPAAGGVSNRVRRLASRLPEVYAQKDEEEARREDLRLKTETLEQQKYADKENLRLSKKQFSSQKEADKRATGLAMGGLGLQGGMAAMKLRGDPGSARYESSGGGWGSAGVGGISGGLAAGGVAKGLGAKKKWQTSLAGAAGGAAMTYLGGGSGMEIGAGALIGGGMGALF
jgi:hypothetical protein